MDRVLQSFPSLFRRRGNNLDSVERLPADIQADLVGVCSRSGMQEELHYRILQVAGASRFINSRSVHAGHPRQVALVDN